MTYALHEALWSAVPEAVLMAAANAVLVVALLRLGAGAWGGRGGPQPCGRSSSPSSPTIGGAGALGVALGAAYGVQVAPAVWTAWRTASPSGVAGATWAMILVEAGLWGIYGVGHGDPATTVLAIVGSAAGVAMLTRKAVVRHRRRQHPAMHRPSERPGAWAVSPLTGTGRTRWSAIERLNVSA